MVHHFSPYKPLQNVDFSEVGNIVYLHPTQITEVSNGSSCTQLLKKIDGSTRYTHMKVGRRKGYFTNFISGGGEKMYTADQICSMIDFQKIILS